MFDALGQCHATGCGLVGADEQLQCLGEAELTDGQRAVLHGRADAFLRDVTSHGVVVPHERRGLGVLRADPVEALDERVLRLMDLLVKEPS